MLWIIALVDKPVEAKTTVARLNSVSDVDIRAEALKREGRGSEAAELLRSYYGGTVIDNAYMSKVARLKDEVYEIRRKPFQSPASEKPLWKSTDGYLASARYDEKYFDVVKDPRSDTLFAAVVVQDSVLLYKGVVDFSGRTVTWSRWVSYYYSGYFLNPSIAVDGAHVWVAFSKAYSASDHDPRLLRVNRSDNSTYLFYLSASTNYEDYPTVTTDYEEFNAYWIYLAYWNANKDSVMFVRVEYPDSNVVNSIGGIAYAVGDNSTVNRMSIEYFGNDYSDRLFLVYTTNGDTILLADGSPLGDVWTERAATFGKGFFPHAKGYRGGPYFAVVYTYPYSSSDYDCRIQYSTDTGATFHQNTCSATTDDELWPTVAFAADTVWVAMLRGDKDTPVDSTTDTMYVMVAALPLSGGYWIHRDSINDPNYKYGVLTTWHPVITGPEDTTSGRQFLHVAWSRRYANTGDFDVRTDYHFFGITTATEEAPVVSSDDVSVVKGGLKVRGAYSIYDLSGRLVGQGNAESGQIVRLKSGSYFVKTPSGIRAVVVR